MTLETQKLMEQLPIATPSLEIWRKQGNSMTNILPDWKQTDEAACPIKICFNSFMKL